MRLSRRDWRRLASSVGAAQLLTPHNVRGAFRPFQSPLSTQTPQAQSPAAQPLFIEVPPSANGIAWVHENAMSPSRFLPEALGPGVAFLDFDNDGWMDV